MEQNRPQRKLTTILCADVAGYSRMMREDEEGTYRALQKCRQEIDRLIAERQGRVFGSAGDSLVAEFASPVEAVRCAVDVQEVLHILNAGWPEDRRLHWRMGVNLGDVIVEETNLMGDGVNVAARLQALAQPGELCVSSGVFDQIKNKLSLDCTDMGLQPVKNIAEPVHIYRVRPKTAPTAARAMASQRPSLFRRFALAAILIAIVAGAATTVLWLWRPHARPADGAAQRITVAVLPFSNLSNDASQDYFVDGITEDLIAALGRFSDLSVISRDAVQRYRGKPPETGELARELGVHYQLEGSVRKEGDHVRVSAQLSDAATGIQLWSSHYDDELKDVFALQDDITRSVAGTLAVKLAGLEQQHTLAKPTDNLQAYDCVLRARASFDLDTRAANAEARLWAEQAIRLDPNYAAAYVALGWARVKAAVSGWTEFREDALHQASALAQKAIALDAADATAHGLLADVYFNNRQFDLALGEDNEALSLNPSDASAYASRATVLVYVGRSGEAIKDFAVATRLNPEIVSDRFNPIGWAYYVQRRYEDAVEAFRPALSKRPDDYFVHAGLAAAYAQLGRHDEAVRAAMEVRRLWPFFTVDLFAGQFQSQDDRLLISDGLNKAGLN